MQIAHFFDLIPVWFLLIGAVLLIVLFIEFGFRLGKKADANSKKAQTSQVRAIMGYQAGLTEKRSPGGDLYTGHCVLRGLT